MKIELISAEDSGRYLVNHTRGIERILQGIKDAKATIAIYGENDRDFVLSTILEIDPGKGRILVERGVDQAMNDLLLKSSGVTIATTYEQVHVQFSSPGIEPVIHGHEPAFSITMPSEVLRLQRREYYRLGTSVVNPVKCLINTGTAFIETLVVDISIGGVGVLAYQEDGSLKAGATYHGCRIALPGAGEFALSLSVRTTFDITLKNGRVTHRAGCHFIDLPPSVETEIQRYIIRVERERRTRFV